MKLTMTEELVIKRRRQCQYAGYWKGASSWSWFRRLLGEFAELGLVLAAETFPWLLGSHKGLLRYELEQIASIAMNWHVVGVLSTERRGI
jgi:hypothetical protein